MKKWLLIVSAVLFLTVPAFARTTVLLPAKASNNTTIFAGGSGASGSSIYTATFDAGDAANYGLSYYVNSTASTVSGNCTPNVTILMQQSFAAPTTESAADIAWSTKSTTTLANNIVNGQWFNQTLSTPNTRYMRFQVIGTAPNATDTTVKINVSKQYDV